MTAPQADLSGWSVAPFSGGGCTYDVYRKGAGPGVLLIPEIPGIHPCVLGLGNHLVGSGFTVAMPSLFGQPGKPSTLGYALATLTRACVTREFAAFAIDKQRPVSLFLRALARDLNASTPGKGVGVIGQCFTGGFALAAAVDDSVLAPVVSQPTIPVALGSRRRRNPGVTEWELTTVANRCADEGLCVIGLRFSEDRMSPADRFVTLKERLGDAFEVIQIDSGAGNVGGFGKMAHSVLTDEVREVDGQPAYEARKRVVEFLTQRLG
ncbi:dienelactone hydrolase family protein [Mycobacterium scrofulaceum]|uniref:Dienelactone hydrolase n=1 Tax=Mycobacterium scrofulaceum TaxID=1783 RepID=A0A1A2VPS6_MYCSC|nr:dienelactone hydrolase family protein [Mycobacterium scrofulaceum]OBI02880.1 dienelactone hydrolase [Mycobacterium scrofulaceum]